MKTTEETRARSINPCGGGADVDAGYPCCRVDGESFGCDDDDVVFFAAAQIHPRRVFVADWH
jgi:hypothetical protein